jgi:hypothetical protein
LKKLFVALGLAVLVSAALWLPSVAQSEDTITATVTVQEIAVSVDPTSVDYGTVAFEGTKRSGTAASPYFTATNNGNVDIDLRVRGANATFTGGSWTIQGSAVSCPGDGTDVFAHSAIGVTSSADDTPIFMTTSTSSSFLDEDLASAGTKDFNSEIFMPCNGSGGLGKTASTDITVVATGS